MKKKHTVRQIPGWWGAFQAMKEIEKQTGISMPRWRWDYYREIGVIPEGIGRALTSQGSQSLTPLWSDSQLFLEIIPAIKGYYGRRQGRPKVKK